MIVKNEEAVLSDCLKSLAGVDEITILDTGSTDRTAEIASQFPCNYIAGKYNWNDNFSEARNESKKYATVEYLIVIDADETLVGNIADIRAEIEANAGQSSFRVKTVSKRYQEHHLSIRIHKNIPEIYWQGAVHNNLYCPVGPVLTSMEVHYGYSPAHVLDPDRAFRILKKECDKNPNASRERYYLAREYFYRRQYPEAIEHLKKYWSVSNFAAEIADSYLMAGRCAIGLQNINDAYEYLFKALRINADLAEAYMLLSKISGPKNSLTWKRMSVTAKNDSALFVRVK
jgi:glycosyltransferase involved in cell wall biosynthesis